MRPEFREDKVTQAAAYFLERGGGEMYHILLLKLLYLADRETLLRWGRPISFDYYVSMKNGPVLSNTLNLINDGNGGSWSDFISSPTGHKVSLIKATGIDELSEAEIEILNEVFVKYGHWDRWELVNHLHKILGEWKNPGASAIPITYRDILLAGGKTEMETTEIEEELNELALVDMILR